MKSSRISEYILIMFVGLCAKLFFHAQAELFFHSGPSRIVSFPFWAFFPLNLVMGISTINTATVSAKWGRKKETVWTEQPIGVANATTRTQSLKTVSQVGLSPVLSGCPNQCATFTDFSNSTFSSPWSGVYFNNKYLVPSLYMYFMSSCTIKMC